MLLQCINILGDISLFLVIILSLQLFYKLFVSDKPSLKWIEYIFSSTNSKRFKALISKLIKLNKNMSMIYIVIILIFIKFNLSYISLELINNLDKYIDVYIEHFRKK